MVTVNDANLKLPVVICSKKKLKTINNVLETDFPKFFSKF